MKEPPFVSMIVPAYNNEDTIEACLLSLIRQTYPAKEIIVVIDEGSIDKTKEILAEMAQGFPSLLRVISTGHVGRSEARNIGWKNSRGDILFFVEADAIYNEDHLERAVECLLSNPKFGGVTMTGALWKVESTFVTECIDVQNRIQRKLIDGGKIVPSWAWIYRREAVEAVGGFDEKLSQAEDKDLFLRVREAGYSFGLVKGVNWHHKGRGRERFFTYITKCFLGGKRRILYVLKHRDMAELFRGVIFPWAYFWMLLASLFFLPLFYVVVAGLAVLLVYKLFTALKLGWSCVEERRYLFLLPIFSALTYVATTLGYSCGAMSIFYEGLTRRSLKWS